MAEVLMTYETRIIRPGGPRYTARACGQPLRKNLWEGWLEFVPDDGSETLRSPRETTQPNRMDLEYWATGIEPIYLEGALDRALRSRREETAPEPGSGLSR